MQKIYITLDELHSLGPCRKGLSKLMRGIEFERADEIRIPLELILDVSGYMDTYWVLYWMDEKLGIPGSKTRLRRLWRDLPSGVFPWGSSGKKAEMAVRKELKGWHRR